MYRIEHNRWTFGHSLKHDIIWILQESKRNQAGTQVAAKRQDSLTEQTNKPAFTLASPSLLSSLSQSSDPQSNEALQARGRRRRGEERSLQCSQPRQYRSATHLAGSASISLTLYPLREKRSCRLQHRGKEPR